MDSTHLQGSERDALLPLMRGAMRFGTFTLSSGATSDFYFDGRQVTLDPRAMAAIGRLVHQQTSDSDGITAVGGPTLGADPLATAVALIGALEFDRTWHAFLVRAEAKKYGAGKQIEGPALGPASRVLLIEDTVTSGGSVLRAAEAVRETGAVIVRAIALLDREEGAAAAFAAAGIPFTALFRRSEFAA